MWVFENIALSLASLRANKMRALLTMLGIIIGIAAVIGIMTVGSSLTGSITGSMMEMGVNNITVSVRSQQAQGRGGGGASVEESGLLSDEMLNGLLETYPDKVEAISLSDQVGSGQSTKGRSYANLSLSGVNTAYASANSITMSQGRFISQRDDENRKKVAVVSDKLAAALLGDTDPLGQKITLTVGSHVGSYTIVGVYEYEQSAAGATAEADEDVSTPVYIPLATAQKITGSGGYQSVTISAAAEVDAASFTETLTQYFNRYYANNDTYSVSVFSMESMVESMTEMLTTVSLAIAAIAAISLLVGGIGVMNIMMVSITERTREIGTRKAIGATNGEIRAQFIVEAMVICLLGGVIGIALGAGLGAFAANALGYPAKASAAVMLGAAAFSMAIGMFFGYYPANKAARLDPIEALRYE